jgi:hypothetical protein
MESGDPFRSIDVLTKHNVPLVIIGGHAVTYHGYVRATEDTDVVVQRTAESDLALFAAILELNARWISDEIDPATGIERTFPVSLGYIQASRLMMLITDFGFLDIFDYIPGHPTEPVELLFASATESHGRRYASLDWLRKMKQISGRAKDQIDLENLPPTS